MNSAPPTLNKFSRRLLRELRAFDLLAGEHQIVIAVSGGADSAALLGALAELKAAAKVKEKLIVAHFNHNLRGAESNEDALFVEKLAQRFKSEFVGGVWRESQKFLNSSGNLEQAARRARYEFLTQTAAAHKASKIFIAHTLDDQAETVLMRLLRGSSAEGLAGMKPITNYKLRITNPDTEQSKIQNPKSKIVLVRPLLSWARREMTENYCRECAIDFRVDRMNFDSRFARVRVRRELLPLLESFNPKIVETLARTAESLSEDNEALSQIAETFLEKTDFSELIVQTPAIRRRVLRLWLEGARGSLKKIERGHLLAIERLFLTGEGGSFVEIPGGIVVKKKGKLLFEARMS